MRHRRDIHARLVMRSVAVAVLLLAPVNAMAQLVAPQAITMRRAPAEAGLADPGAAFWQTVDAVRIPVMAQAITTPVLAKASVGVLEVKAAHDGRMWAVQISWRDETRSDRIVVDNFGDQVAVEVPMRFQAGALPSPMMGNPGGRVAVLQWRAAFQHDVEHGHPKLRDVYPNALIDLYPDEVLNEINAKPYSGALGLDNPVSTAVHSPVLDQMAEGFGTLTVKPEQHAGGRGAWAGVMWKVVVTHPLSAGGEYDPDVKPGSETAIAFAVWDGGNNEVGSRKAWAPWVTVKVEP